MSRPILFLAALALLGPLPASAAGPLCPGPIARELECARAAIGFCCPDYCPKPPPCIACVPLAPDACYRPKPQPCIPCLCLPRCPDNYCPKPLPQFCCPAWCTDN